MKIVILNGSPRGNGNTAAMVEAFARCALSAPVLVSLGDPSTTVIQPREVFAVAFKAEDKAVILAHNHPSGNPTPSVQDRELTSALVSLGDQLGVKVLDHLVIGDEDKTVTLLKSKE